MPPISEMSLGAWNAATAEGIDGYPAAPGPSLRTSAVVSNLREKMGEWRCGFDALQRVAWSRRLTSRRGQLTWEAK
jgi:hypothetical protein